MDDGIALHIAGVKTPHDGDFLQPLPSARLDGERLRVQGPSPRLGEHTGTIDERVRPSAAVGGSAGKLPFEGLRVIDASIMPAIPSANTVAATYCLAEKGADLVLGEAG